MKVAGVDTTAAATLAKTVGTADETVAVTKPTTGAAAVAEVVDFVAPTIPAIKAGDKISVDVGGTTITTSALALSDNLAAVVAALNAAEGASNFSATNSNANIRYTFAAGGAKTDSTHLALKYIPKEGTVSVSTAGVNAPAAVTAAATKTSTAGTATAQRAGNFATRSSTEIIQAKSTISLVESAKIKFDKTAMSTGFSTYVAANTGGKYSLTGTDAKSFSIDQTTGMVKNELNMDFETKASFNINVVYTDTNSKTFTEAVNLVLTDSTADSGTHLNDLNVGTQSGAASAITILDTALNQISASQAELGAIQNRLQHNIDNLSMGSMLTETARGRIVDADFAKETSELSKQQILGQAATSMLAQANQSKQSVLALLQ
jgi:flagellin-like hook-associated protein FlgL